MPLSPEETKKSKHIDLLVEFFQIEIDKELSLGRHERITVHLSHSQENFTVGDVTENVKERIRKNYQNVGWKNVKIEYFSRDYYHVTLS